MSAIWLLTVLANLSLTLLLVFRKHYVRFGWLTVATGLSVFLDAYFAYIRYWHHALYIPSRNVIFFLFLFFNGMIIAESWEEKRVRIPMEIITGAEVCALLLKKAGFLYCVYLVNNGTRILNLLLTLFFLYIFRVDPLQLRKESYDGPRAERREEAEA